MNVHHFLNERTRYGRFSQHLPSGILEWMDAILAVIFLALVIVIPGSLVLMGLVTLWKKVFG